MVSSLEYDKLKIAYDRDAQQFNIRLSPNDSVIIRSNLQLDSSEDCSDYDLYLLYNDKIAENDIYQVYDKKADIRIGWIFPVYALVSDSHDYAKNEHFLKYAYVSLMILLQYVLSDKELLGGEFDLEHDVEEILKKEYDIDNMVILVTCCSNTVNIPNYDISNYIASLYRYGYTFRGSGNSDAEKKQLDKRINLTSLSKDIKNVQYINSLFVDVLPNLSDALSRFITYYQVVEALIFQIHEDKFYRVINNTKETECEADNTIDSFWLSDRIREILPEKYRVVSLFNEYYQGGCNGFDDLEDMCIQFLDNQRAEKRDSNLPGRLYRTRCIIVHKMYTLDKDCLMMLEEINKSFSDVVTDLVCFFKLP